MVCTTEMSPRTMQVFLVFGVLGGLSLFSTPCTAQSLEYGCFPNSTFILLNPGNFNRVFAYDSQGICTTVWSGDKTSITLTDCHLDTDIIVNFNNLDFNADIKIIATSNKFLIRCVDVPEEGAVWYVTNEFTADVGIKQNVTLSFPIQSNIYQDPEFTQLATEELVGTTLFWHIQGHPDYHMRPVECWAYAGKGISDSVPKKNLHKDGCTAESDLTGNFQWVDGTNGFRVFTYLTAFKFYTSDYVTMECEVQICKDPSTYCNINCPARKRRFVGDVGNSADDEFSSVTVSSPPLKIVALQDLMFLSMSRSSSVVGSGCLWITMAWLILKVVCTET